MNKIFILTILFFAIQTCFGQTEVIRKNKITKSVTETYNTIITSDRQVKQGPYRALYNKKVVLAQGKYADDKRVGIWRFFNTNQKILQIYNYDNGTLQYEAPEGTTSNFRYIIDADITDSSRVTKPLKQGGRYFGYLPYMRFFSLPAELQGTDVSDINVTIELLISPMGRVADFKIRLESAYYNYKRDYSIDANKLFMEDRTFLPATKNKEPISSTIVISCFINSGGELDMDVED